MAEFSVSELKLFENIFIQGGYVLDFNNPSFRQFILKATNIDVYNEEYSNTVANEMGSASKGKTLMYFINNESESNVLKLLTELIKYAEVIDYKEYGITLKQLNKAKEIINKHKSNKINTDSPKSVPDNKITEFSVPELKLLENIFIQGGYVLDFNNPNFRQFILKATNIDVYDEEYSNNVSTEMGSSSKGKTLMYFINNESESNVLKLLTELIEYAEVIDYKEYGITLKQLNKAKEIINKHKSNKINIDSLKSGSDDLKEVINYSGQNHPKPPFHSYKDGENYIFVSYAHLDKERVFAELERFHNQGYPIWYDDGIEPANEWPKEIEEALLKSSLFVVFISENAIESTNVRNEINLAIDEKIPVIAIYLEETELKYGLKLRLSSIQGILKFSIPDEEYVSKYTAAFNQRGIKPLKEHKRENKPLNLPTAPLNRLKTVPEAKPVGKNSISELEKSDEIIIKSMGDLILKNKIHSLSFDDIVELTKDFDLTNDDVIMSLEFLKDSNYIQYTPTINGPPLNIRFTYGGLLLYCKNYVDNFEYLLKKIFSAIINENLKSNNEIIEKTNINKIIVNGILDCLNDKNYIKIAKTMDRRVIIHKITEKGKRYMKNYLKNNQDIYTVYK